MYHDIVHVCNHNMLTSSIYISYITYFTWIDSSTPVVNRDFLLLYVNLLWPCDPIGRHRAGSTLVQVMACRLTQASHCLNQCLLGISEVVWHSYEGNAQDIYSWYEFENYQFKTKTAFPSRQWVDRICPGKCCWLKPCERCVKHLKRVVHFRSRYVCVHAYISIYIS